MISSAIAAVGDAIAKIFGFATQKDAQLNSPAVQAAAEKARQQKEIDKINRDVANENLNSVRNELAD